MPTDMGENNISSSSAQAQLAGDTPMGETLSSNGAWYAEDVIAKQLGADIPPMLQQYLSVKRANPDCVIFFQVGDFYEVFFDDAVEVSRRINLTLTSRDKGRENPIRMCGVPVAHIESYLERIVDTGLSCAIVSQVASQAIESESTSEAVQSNGATRAPVQRKLTRIITPGVRVLSTVEGSARETLCAAVSVAGAAYSIAATDVRSGEIQVIQEVGLSDLIMEVRRLAPSELLLPAREQGRPLDRRSSWVRAIERILPGVSLKFRFGDLAERGTSSDASTSLRDPSSIPGFSILPPLTKRAVRGLVAHIDQTTGASRVCFSAVREQTLSKKMLIDAMTRQNLELVKSSREGGEAGTLLSVLKHTVSEPGARLLRGWILEPLTDRKAIHLRLDAVEVLRGDAAWRAATRAKLSGLVDLERVATRLELRAITPRELGSIRSAFAAASEIVSRAFPKSALIEAIIGQMPSPKVLLAELSAAISEELPWALHEGGVMRPGFDSELDSIRAQRTGSGEWMRAFEASERERTGIGSLKVKNNNVLGFFIEVTRANAGKIPSEYQRRQSTAQAERFTTDELRAAERDFQSASSRELARERMLYEALVERLIAQVPTIRAVGRDLAHLDVLLSLAQAAELNRWVRPSVEEHCQLRIEKGAHPVLAEFLRGSFVPNDLILKPGERELLILTGPNMGGKSTYLRQIALIVIMAQLGSFVPAECAEIGIVDRIFARIGASDNISEGESTFMVEMREMAYILANATERSLVVIDEVGRGTATADGVSLARAIVEWLVGIVHCRTLFATHYHELTALAQAFEQIRNVSVTSVEENGEVIFTHLISEGPANRSYGVEVARIAGLPPELIGRARELLDCFGVGEGTVVGGRAAVDQAQIPLFKLVSSNAVTNPRGKRPPKSEESEIVMQRARKFEQLRSKLEVVDINATTPLQALEILETLRTCVAEAATASATGTKPAT